MNKAWFLVLIVPAVFLTGCLQFPDAEARKQTVQKGAPPPVDPNLPPGQKPATTPAAAAGQRPGQAGMPVPKANDPRLQVTAEQVTANNAEDMAEALFQEIDADINDNPGATGVPATAPTTRK